jgi:hypothetical protein
VVPYRRYGRSMFSNLPSHRLWGLGRNAWKIALYLAQICARKVLRPRSNSPSLDVEVLRSGCRSRDCSRAVQSTGAPHAVPKSKNKWQTSRYPDRAGQISGCCPPVVSAFSRWHPLMLHPPPPNWLHRRPGGELVPRVPCTDFEPSPALAPNAVFMPAVPTSSV